MAICRPRLAQIDEAVGLARTTGDPRLMADLLGRRAVFKGEAGDLDAAFADHQETLALSRAAGDNYRLAITLANLGVDEARGGGAPGGPRAPSGGEHARRQPRLPEPVRRSCGRTWVSSTSSTPIPAMPAACSSTAWTPPGSPVSSLLIFTARSWASPWRPAQTATPPSPPPCTASPRTLEQAGRAFEAIEAGLRDRDHAQSARHAGRCRVRGRLPARPHAQPCRRHRPGHCSSRARSRG